jgi:hypothetical protein
VLVVETRSVVMWKSDVWVVLMYSQHSSCMTQIPKFRSITEAAQIFVVCCFLRLRSKAVRISIYLFQKDERVFNRKLLVHKIVFSCKCSVVSHWLYSLCFFVFYSSYLLYATKA